MNMSVKCANMNSQKEWNKIKLCKNMNGVVFRNDYQNVDHVVKRKKLNAMTCEKILLWK